MRDLRQFLARFSRGEFSLARTEAFSDAVYAIIVTLLVLDLKVPHLHEVNSVGELATPLGALAPKFVSWPISFVGAALAWVNIYAGFAVYALTPLFYITPRDCHGARTRRPARGRRGR